MQSHMVRVGLFMVDVNGNRIDKNNPNTKISDVLNSSSDYLVIPDIAVPNSANYPTIKAYLNAEAGSGFELKHMDQSIIVTSSP